MMIQRLKFILSIFLLSSVASLQAQEEVVVLNKTWQIGYTAENAQQQLSEYVIAGESVENWSELVTRQIFIDPTSRISLNKLINLIRNGFGRDCNDFNWTVVKSTEYEVLYTWSHNGCSNFAAQAERALITRVPKGLCRWAYATKKPPLNTPTEVILDVDLAKQSCD